MKWEAKWIFDSAEAHPRNKWVCFRKTFTLDDNVDESTLNISADSKYIAYMDGERLGDGPVRGWPSKWSYDTYECNYLSKGTHVVSVLVNHIGTSTMQYIEGRAGFICQLDFLDYNNKGPITSDSTWKVMNHEAFIRDTTRMSNCLSFDEVFDAQKEPIGWQLIDFDDTNWEKATIIGEYGMSPWGELIPRDIPMLTDEKLYSEKTISVSDVKPIQEYYSLDLRPVFFPNDYENNSGNVIEGFVLTSIQSSKNTIAKISYIVDPHANANQGIRINGERFVFENGKEVEVKLKKGDNMVIIDVGMTIHQPTIHLIIDCEAIIKLLSPIETYDHQFLVVGPLFAEKYLQIGSLPKDTYKPTLTYQKMQTFKTIEEFKPYENIIKPLEPYLVSRHNASIPALYKKREEKKPLDFQYQYLTIANSSYTCIESKADYDTQIVVDFGKEMLGELFIDLSSEEGAVIDLFCFESMHEDGRIEHTFSLNNSLRYYARQGRQTFRSFIPRGFRYVMLTFRNTSKSCLIYELSAYMKTFPTGDVGNFFSSDYLLNEIWNISKQTVRMCTQDTIIDCPAYEQVLWTGDSYNISLINYYLFGNDDLIRRCLRLISQSLDRTIFPESHVPSGWQNVLTAWSILWIMAIKEYYYFTGDLNFVSEIFPFVKLTLKNFERYINADGLLEIDAWNMLDWASMDTDKDIVTHQNALLVRAYMDSAVIAAYLGEINISSEYEKKAKGLKKSINNLLWDNKSKAYVDSMTEDGELSSTMSIQTQLMVFLSDIPEGERLEHLVSYLIDQPEHFVQIQSPFVLFFYYEAMRKLGRLDITLNNIKETYGYMLKNNATTCWEGWKLIEGDYSRSHCHAWSAAPAYVVGRSILGIEPMKPGFEKVRVSPVFGLLEWFKGTVPTPHGPLDVQIESNFITKINLNIPDGVEVELHVPKDICITINTSLYKKDLFPQITCINY